MKCSCLHPPHPDSSHKMKRITFFKTSLLTQSMFIYVIPQLIVKFFYENTFFKLKWFWGVFMLHYHYYLATEKDYLRYALKKWKIKGFCPKLVEPLPYSSYLGQKFRTFWSVIGPPPSFDNLVIIGNKIGFKITYIRWILTIWENYKGCLFTFCHSQSRKW